MKITKALTNYEMQQEVLKIIESGKTAAIATVVNSVGSAPQKQGAKMIIFEDGNILGTIGGGAIEHRVTEDALKVIKASKPSFLAYNLGAHLGMCCGGKMDVFIEPIDKLNKLLVFGAGHIASELVPLTKKLGFKITVIDDREDFATKERFPDADELIISDYADILKKLTFDAKTYVVIITHMHKSDDEILGYIIDKKYAYLGMIGSSAKFEKTKLKLKTNSVPDELITQVKTPIGLDINAKTPFEIALSIAAELTIEKYKKELHD